MTASSPRPAAPDTTGGELREAIKEGLRQRMDGELWCSARDAGDLADAVLALPALRDLLAERDTLAAQVQAVEGLADIWESDAKRHDDAEPINSDGLTRMILAARFLRTNAADLRRALGTPTTGGGE